jgi:hypothetical protein
MTRCDNVYYVVTETTATLRTTLTAAPQHVNLLSRVDIWVC